MNKQEQVAAKKDQKNKKARERPNKNGVIITVYIESPHQKSNPIKKIKPDPLPKKPKTATSHGYDRRSQLLAYAQELREANNHNQYVQWPRKSSRPKPKIAFLWIKRRRRYERIVSEENTQVDGCSKKKKAPRRSISQTCWKLKCMLKELSCGC